MSKTAVRKHGRLAQLGEHLLCKHIFVVIPWFVSSDRDSPRTQGKTAKLFPECDLDEFELNNHYM
jgi:hypothetical protein